MRLWWEDLAVVPGSVVGFDSELALGSSAVSVVIVAVVVKPDAVVEWRIVGLESVDSD